MLASAVLTLVAAPSLRAQARTTISVIPVGGATLPLADFVDDPDFRLTPQFGVFVGALAELSMNKNLSLFGEATRTLGATQKLDAEFPSCTSCDQLTTDMATTQVSGGIIFRPLGRLPSGAPRSVYLEAGAGISLFSVSRGFQDPSDPQELDFNGNSPFVTGGIGLSFPAGPRFSVQVHGRVQYHLGEYSSEGLDDLESPTFFDRQMEAKKPMVVQLGIGLRIGR
jgi:hypothetical protein